MCLPNHYSSLTENSPIGSSGAEFFDHLTRHSVLRGFLLSALFTLALIVIVPPAFSQDSSDPNFQKSLAEDPLAESDADLGLEEEPMAESSAEIR